MRCSESCNVVGICMILCVCVCVPVRVKSVWSTFVCFFPIACVLTFFVEVFLGCIEIHGAIVSWWSGDFAQLRTCQRPKRNGHVTVAVSFTIVLVVEQQKEQKRVKAVFKNRQGFYFVISFIVTLTFQGIQTRQKCVEVWGKGVPATVYVHRVSRASYQLGGIWKTAISTKAFCDCTLFKKHPKQG